MTPKNPFLFPLMKPGISGRSLSPAGNGHSRIYGSPVMRRVRRAGPPSSDPMMRKSVSLTNVDGSTSQGPIDVDADIDGDASSVIDIQRKNRAAGDETDSANNVVEPAKASHPGDNMTFIKIRVDRYGRPDGEESDDDVVREIKPAGAIVDFSNSAATGVATLPRAGGGGKRTGGVGFVPKMRLMFERARSLEPEARLNSRKRINRFADGTESVSSFVLEESPAKLKSSSSQRARSELRRAANSPSTSSSSSSNSFEFEDPSSSVASSNLSTTISNNASASNASGTVNGTGTVNKKGFVNKCMTRVRNLMGSKNGLQS